MKASESLFFLIKSLSQNEKRYFKVSASLHVLGEKNNYEKIRVNASYDSVMKRSSRARFDQRAAKAWDDAEDEALRVTYHGAEPEDEPVLGPAKTPERHA